MMHKYYIIFLFFCLPLLIYSQDKPKVFLKQENTIKISSFSFKEKAFIPVQYTCKGLNISPHLQWGAIPLNTKSLVIICEDPDAPSGDWVHWLLFNIPPDINFLSEGIAGEKILKTGAKQGLNDFGSIGYGGPCPPPGQTHRYNFKIFALDVTLDLEPAIEKQILLKAVKNHILAKGQLTGAFKR